MNPTAEAALIVKLRQVFQRRVCAEVISARPSKKYGPTYSIADSSDRLSVFITNGIISRLENLLHDTSLSGQTAGTKFEIVVRDFVEEALTALAHLRPGRWQYQVRQDITSFAQYSHLAILRKLLAENKDLKTAFGDYLVQPDVVVGRVPFTDDEINAGGNIVGDGTVSILTPARAANHLDSPSPAPILHASISCKLTFRSDRSQNARTEGLNVIRNRKGHTPHIVVVTAEPLPSRLASLALGTGDIDCVYHFALHELIDTLAEKRDHGSIDILDTMVNGDRLRDISDLPFDLLT